MYFIEKIIQSIRDKRSIVCMGLDPRMDGPGQIPEYMVNELKDPNKIILEFNKSLIENVHDLIPVIKPQIAFYEKYEAFHALKETIKYAHKKDLLVILDSKRNDIGSTSEAYADATFKVYGADACTLNAYLGIDGIKPYLDNYKEKGLFILVKTSNPSSSDFQNLFSIRLDNIHINQIEIEKKAINLERNYIHMAKLVKKWGKDLEKFSDFHSLGVVVGATFPQELQAVRKIVENSFILLPGYGTQGAQAKDIVHGFDKNGLGGIVNSSRGIMFAYKKQQKSPDKFAEAARHEIIDMNHKINKELGI
jgi:orotidine-5'-phosphate decarboxylase